MGDLDINAAAAAPAAFIINAFVLAVQVSGGRAVRMLPGLLRIGLRVSRPGRVFNGRVIIDIVLSGILGLPVFITAGITVGISVVEPVVFTGTHDIPAHTAGVVQQEHDYRRCGLDLGFQGDIGQIGTPPGGGATAGAVTGGTVLIDTVVTDIEGAGMDGGGAVIAVVTIQDIIVAR